MICRFAKVTQVTLVYEFGGFFFLIELNFLSSIFSHIVKKKIVLEKSYIITWFTNLTILTFFN